MWRIAMMLAWNCDQLFASGLWIRRQRSPTPLASRTGSSFVAARCPSPRYFQSASVASTGAEPNGPSSHPSLDGDATHAPHCVAFESEAYNACVHTADRREALQAFKEKRTPRFVGG